MGKYRCCHSSFSFIIYFIELRIVRSWVWPSLAHGTIQGSQSNIISVWACITCVWCSSRFYNVIVHILQWCNQPTDNIHSIALFTLSQYTHCFAIADGKILIYFEVLNTLWKWVKPYMHDYLLWLGKWQFTVSVELPTLQSVLTNTFYE